MVKTKLEEYILQEGDSIYLDSTIHHRYINIGTEECVSIWAMTPPSF
ncbi:transcriptional regulator [Caldisalinibacter kiritimatiensis]|uniref:Transcriptional regulator n=2 Tax=Caldisalinibacter kiritimatiensis TaxID=1304284 RepID=R1ATR9_9FIRM|nr:transcriptional regulator [Caldisalinibacter kiritimatiensis]